MEENNKTKQYQRIVNQLDELLTKTDNPIARMATVIALLHHKKSYFFWTGFYLLDNGILTVGPYQGTLACQVLKKDVGVCWAAINQQKSIIVADVNLFPGHIACDSNSKSEITVPLKNKEGIIIGVLDVDSKEFNSFDNIDAEYLEKIVTKIYCL